MSEFNKENTVTGYKMSKMVNEKLDDQELKNIPPQMIYNYVSKGFIKSVQVEGQNRIPVQEVQDWTDKYINKKLERVQNQEEELNVDAVV